MSNYSEEKNITQAIPAELIKKNIHKAAMDGHENICLSGFNPIHFHDPLEREDIIHLLEYAAGQGIRRIKLYTRLHSIESSKKVDEFTQLGAMFYQVPLFGHNADVHDAVAGKDSFDKTMTGIDFIKNTKVKCTHWSPFLHIDIILDKNNYKSVKEILDLAINKKADIIHVSASFSHFTFTDIIKPVTEVIEIALEKRSWIFIKDIPPCLLPGFEYFIYELYAGDTTLEKKIKISVCHECVYNTICSGIKEDYIRRYTDKEFSPVKHSTFDIKALQDIKMNQVKPQI